MPAAPLVAILSAAAMLGFARLYAVPVLTALGRPRTVLGIRLAETPMLLALPLLGPGLLGATAIYAWRSLPALPLELRALAGAAGLSPARQASGLWQLALLAAAMAAAVFLLGRALAGWPPAAVLGTQVVAGVALWPGLLALARRTVLRRVVRVVARTVRGR